MKKHTTLYVLGAALLLVGGYMYISKSKSNKINTIPPMESQDNSDSTTQPDTTTETPKSNTSTGGTLTGGTLTGVSQILDSIKGIISEVKTKSTNAVNSTIADIPVNIPLNRPV
jgi:hypothetical protein